MWLKIGTPTTESISAVVLMLHVGATAFTIGLGSLELLIIVDTRLIHGLLDELVRVRRVLN